MNARQTVLVTGGTGALGAAIVAALCERKYHVVANYYRDENRARALAELSGCELVRADVREESAVAQLLGKRRFDAIVHAAGANRDALMLRTSTEAWRAQMRWLDAAFLVTRAALDCLPDGGRLLLIASRVGERGRGGQSAYATSKGATLGLMRAAAAERPSLRINAICPGFVPSALSENLGATARQSRASENLLPAAESAQSLAASCAWLLESNVSGQIVRPDCRL